MKNKSSKQENNVKGQNRDKV